MARSCQYECGCFRLGKETAVNSVLNSRHPDGAAFCKWISCFCAIPRKKAAIVLVNRKNVVPLQRIW